MYDPPYFQISNRKNLKSKKSTAPISRVLCWPKPVPAIYLLRTSPCVSSVLPSIAGLATLRAGNPQSMVYMNLQPPDGTARRSPAGWWSLTPPSHPYLLDGGGHSLLPYPTVANCFYFQKWSALCCPDFPPVSSFHSPRGRRGQETSGKPEQCFRICKVTLFL